MANWFENHPATSIISHAITVAVATGAFFLFVFDSNKVEAAHAVAEQHKAKVESLESEIASLRSENAKYLSWMSETPNTIPYLEARLKSLSEENARLAEVASSKPVTPNMSSRYGKAAQLSIGETFIDPETFVTLGLGRVNPDFTASVNVTLPDGSISVPSAKPGEVWRFSKGDRSFRLMLERVNWYANQVTVSVAELPPGE